MERRLAVRDWHWEVTKKCNLKCRHCILGGCSSQEQELTTQDSLRVISRIVQLGGKTLRITGGEPLMRKRSRPNYSGGTRFWIRPRLNTNRTMLDDDFRKYGQCISHMAISIDGQKEAHEYLRGIGSYEKSILAAKKIMDVGIDLSVYITVHSLNESSLDLLVDELVSLGLEVFILMKSIWKEKHRKIGICFSDGKRLPIDLIAYCPSYKKS